MSSMSTGQRFDVKAKVSQMSKEPSLPELKGEFERLRERLSQTGHLSQGSVQDRTKRKGGGAGYQWTRKVAGKTVTLVLTKEQFGRMREAIANYRLLRKQLKKMEQLSRQIIFREAPHESRRKNLAPKVLGIK